MENAGVDNVARDDMGGKRRSGEMTWVENAGVENAARDDMGGKCGSGKGGTK